MAKTTRKRRSKHRGTAAGTIESRGRTGRKPTSKESASPKQSARDRRMARFDQPPTWRSATIRAGLAAAVFFVMITFLFEQPLSASIWLALFTLAIYIPLGYYTDQFIYRRRQKRKAAERAKS